MPTLGLATVYLGLGSNLCDRRAFIEAAVGALVGDGIVVDAKVSPLYETEAVADAPQPAYLNAVLRARTQLAPAVLLARGLEIESRLGRQRPIGVSKAPRTIDIDLLLYASDVIDSPELEIPHPRLLERAFVLIPLADVAEAGLVHPITGASLTVARPSPTVVRRF